MRIQCNNCQAHLTAQERPGVSCCLPVAASLALTVALTFAVGRWGLLAVLPLAVLGIWLGIRVTPRLLRLSRCPACGSRNWSAPFQPVKTEARAILEERLQPFREMSFAQLRASLEEAHTENITSPSGRRYVVAVMGFVDREKGPGGRREPRVIHVTAEIGEGDARDQLEELAEASFRINTKDEVMDEAHE